MDFQVKFNILVIFVVVGSTVSNFMHLVGAIKHKHTGGKVANAVCLITYVVGVLGWGFFLTLLITDGGFMLEKISLLIGW